MTAYKISVLFVDDEPNVLAALKRMLRAKRNEWKMEFVDSGVAALALLEDMKFDVVVSDIKMPGMDGADLLNKVKDKYPGMIRMALSGQVGLNEVIRSIRAVHQYISKPCKAEELIDKIEGAIKSREILTDPEMQKLVTEIESLPVTPNVFESIEIELKSTDPSIKKVAEYISMDVGLVAKILRLVNSPYFGLPTQIGSISQAITMLGLESVKALILSTHLFAMYDEKKLPNFSLNLLWEHSFRVSNIIRLICECEKIDKVVAVQARMAGLLHDIGKLVLANSFSVQYGKVIKKVAETHQPICDCEIEILGTTHAHIGAYLMGLWGMSGDIVHGIGAHHQYQDFDMSVSMLVSIADAIDHQCVIINPGYVRIALDRNILPDGQHGLQLEKWINYVKDHWEGLDEFQDLDADMLAQLRS
ncbi:HD-like signal output (HDOD) domain, no enzymatic activity [Maridesulfovibrio ferrireducens]|uniref:HD-like signal output (HDOD) domain, no enzymatic activity n=1 Tax=Maridesulfovibrio ferrireducens TaxID=246191 RepID=A0A1G9FTN0_9BACT|nr:response regulator [Maridesulfovibrio ferrireducens]SDK91717.1 HD-like signal output (HDOD) domain, no enzymatic activity [Maridesulfovibrio ferrireducens]